MRYRAGAEIASRAALDERYVREWLAAMSTGRIVEHDGAAGSYSLLAGHAAWLTRAAGMNNLAGGMQYIGLMALVEDQIVDCFRHGGGGPVLSVPEAARNGLANVRFEKRDAARLGEAGRFDFIATFDAVHDQARPDLVLAGIAGALRPGGVYLCVDTAASSTLADNLDHPLGPSCTPSRACTA